MQRRINEVETKSENNQNMVPGGNAETQQADRDKGTPAAVAGAGGGTGGLGTHQKAGGDVGATGTGYHGHMGGGGTATENNT